MFEFIKSGKIKFFEYASDLKLDNFLFESCKNCNFKEKVEQIDEVYNDMSLQFSK